MANWMANWYKTHKSKQREYNDRFRVSRTEWFIHLKGTLKCTQCSESHVACIVFHHDDPSKKEYSVSKMAAAGFSIERILEEIAKCTVLCANCHAKHHWKRAKRK